MTVSVPMHCLSHRYSTIMFIAMKFCTYILPWVLYILTRLKPFFSVLRYIEVVHRSYIHPLYTYYLPIRRFFSYERHRSSCFGTKYYCPPAISNTFQNLGHLIFTRTKTFSSIKVTYLP